MTSAERICEEAGVSVSHVCKKARISERTFRRYATQGVPDSAAEKLCWVLGEKIDPMIFVFGYSRWKKLAEEIRCCRDAHSAAGDNTSRRQRPVSILKLL